MDLGAYANIDILDEIAKRNGGISMRRNKNVIKVLIRTLTFSVIGLVLVIVALLAIFGM